MKGFCDESIDGVEHYIERGQGYIFLKVGVQISINTTCVIQSSKKRLQEYGTGGIVCGLWACKDTAVRLGGTS
jgi:hypothetical protein